MCVTVIGVNLLATGCARSSIRGCGEEKDRDGERASPQAVLDVAGLTVSYATRRGGSTPSTT